MDIGLDTVITEHFIAAVEHHRIRMIIQYYCADKGYRHQYRKNNVRRSVATEFDFAGTHNNKKRQIFFALM